MIKWLPYCRKYVLLKHISSLEYARLYPKTFNFSLKWWNRWFSGLFARHQTQGTLLRYERAKTGSKRQIKTLCVAWWVNITRFTEAAPLRFKMMYNMMILFHTYFFDQFVNAWNEIFKLSDFCQNSKICDLLTWFWKFEQFSQRVGFWKCLHY